MNRSEIESVIHAFYASRLANDVERIVAFFAPDAVLRVAGAPESSPIVASSKTTESIRAQVIQLVNAWKWESYEIQAICIEGQQVALYYRLKTTFRPTGAPVDTQIADFITVRDGKITSFVQFLDTALVARIVAPFLSGQ